MDEFNWDAYFERRSRVQYEYWKRGYNNRVEEARDKEIARQHYSILLHMFDMQTTPQGHFGRNITSNGELVDPAYEQTVDYYDRLYASFKLTWQLQSQLPVTRFLEHTAPEIIRTYRLNLARLANEFDWEKQAAAQIEATVYLQSEVGRKEIINWLAFCAARDLIKKEVVPIENIDLDSLNTPFENDMPSFIIPSPIKDNSTKKPKRESTQTDYQLISAKVKARITKGSSKPEAIKEVGEEMGRTERVIYNALKAYPLNFWS